MSRLDDCCVMCKAVGGVITIQLVAVFGGGHKVMVKADWCVTISLT